MAIWCMRIACWITRAADIHSEYFILTSFPLQQWLHESTSILRYMYIACLICVAWPYQQVTLHLDSTVVGGEEHQNAWWLQEDIFHLEFIPAADMLIEWLYY